MDVALKLRRRLIKAAREKSEGRHQRLPRSKAIVSLVRRQGGRSKRNALANPAHSVDSLLLFAPRDLLLNG